MESGGGSVTSISLSPVVDVLVVTEVGFVEKNAIYGKVSQSLVKRIPLQTNLCVNITIPTLSNYFTPSQFDSLTMRLRHAAGLVF